MLRSNFYGILEEPLAADFYTPRSISIEVNWNPFMLNVISQGFHKPITKVCVVFLGTFNSDLSSRIDSVQAGCRNMLWKLIEV